METRFPAPSYPPVAPAYRLTAGGTKERQFRHALPQSLNEYGGSTGYVTYAFNERHEVLAFKVSLW